MPFPAVKRAGNFLEGRGVEPDSDVPIIGFPESFSRTAPPRREEEDDISDDMSDSARYPGINSLSFPRASSLDAEEQTATPRRVSRSSVMRLENILNHASIDSIPHRRSRSLGRSPIESPHFETFVTLPHVSTLITRSQSPDESVVKKKKVKMHRCPECQKDFPRPSGLRTHMNTHTKEKPFACNYPGCTRSFSVVSNAKRHMRTHGLGVPPDDSESVATPYVVGFEAPVVVSPRLAVHSSNSSDSPVRLRWIPSSPTEGRRASIDGSHSGSVLQFGDGQLLSSSSQQAAAGVGWVALTP